MYSEKDRLDVRAVALNWYRDSSSKDLTICDGISIGTTISCAVWQGISAILQYSSKYREPSDLSEIRRLPSDSSRLRIRVASRYGPVALDLDPTGELVVDEQFLQPYMLRVPVIASIVRQIQVPLGSLLRRRRNLYITDWITAKWSRSDPNGLVLYRKSILKSAIPAVSEDELSRAGSFFPPKIDDLFTYERLESTTNRLNIQWTSDELALIVEYVRDLYVEIRESLVRSAAQFMNMLDFYRPTRVFLPADAFEPWLILYQLCRGSGIETVMCVDGYMCLPLWPALKDETGGEWLVDRALAYGTAQAEHIRRTGFPSDRIELVEPPFLKYLTVNSARPDLDLVILTWVPYTVNPGADYSSPFRTLVEALRAAQSCGYKRVGVKIKADEEKGYVLRAATDAGVEIEILQGRFYKHVHRSKLFVGGISTALAEAVASGARYVVFEPYENGYTDEMIDSSSVLTRDSVIRDGVGLVTALRGNETSWQGSPENNLFV